MPRKDGTGPDGKGPKKVNQGVPRPRRDDVVNSRGTGRGTGTGRGRGRGQGKK